MTPAADRAGTACGPAAASRRRPRVLALIVALLGAWLVPARADNTAAALEAAGWSETSPGLLASLPQRTARIRGPQVEADFVLVPGTSLAWERRVRDAGGALEIEIRCDGPNASSDDYRAGRATFPVSVTAVFGRDSLDLPLKTRIGNFLARLVRGFPPGGICLTYAVGNAAPVGSMYRLSDEHTVFILAGEEEKGKPVAVRRDLAADFRAAYGKEPTGPVTRLIVRAERPSRESGTVKAGVRLAFPGK